MKYESVDIIKNAIKNNKLSHAYLFYGDKGVNLENQVFDSIKFIFSSLGKKIEAKNMNEINYFDLKIIEPDLEKKIITKDSVNLAIEKLLETSLEEKTPKILYIKNIEFGNKSSLNRLLKFIEEPTENLIIFITSNNFENVISTIKSRTQNIFVKRSNLSQKINQLSKIKSKYISLLANIYSEHKINEMNTSLFDETVNKIFDSFQKAAENKFFLKEELYKCWTKENNLFFLNILEFFFYQLMVDIDEKNPLFPNKDKIINEYKTKNINSFLIILKISKTKHCLEKYGNFNIQKINLLNEIEKGIIQK